MSLWEDLAAVDKEGLLLSNDNNVCYPTGYKVLDYANGYWSETRDPKTGERKLIPNLGIPAGSMVSIIGASGNGKALPDLAQLPTPYGVVRADSLKVGDELFNREGKPVKILGIYPQGEKDMYQVTFKDGRTAMCCEDHLWTVIKGYGRKEKVMTLPLKDLMKDYEKPQNGFNRVIQCHPYAVPTNGVVQFASRNVSIDPWILGTFIGNGCLTGKYLTISCGTDEIPKKICEMMGWKCKKNPTTYSYIFYSLETGKLIRCDDFFKDYPELLDYSYNKHIPQDYIYNNEYVRRGVLSGLLDTDGSIYSSKYQIHYSTTSTNLKNDILNLCRSLGYHPSVSIDSRTEKYTSGICYDIYISCPDEDKPFLFRTEAKHHRAREGVKTYSTRKYYDRLIITKIEKLGRCTMRCFMVDDPEHLFLTENYVVTHNTTLAWQIGWNIVKDFKDGLLILIDCEKSSIKQRLLNITGCTYDDPRARILKSHTSIDDVLEQFEMICELKKTNGKKYMYEVKNQSFDGKPFWQYVPTVFVIDSLPSFNSKEYNVKDLGNQIDQMKATKDISRFYTNVLDRAWEFNVIFIVINHIRAASITNPYAKPPRGLMMINPETEVLPRGSVAQYYSGTYFRINSIKSNAYTMKDYGFTGYKCDIQLTKSKSNSVGTTFPVSFISEKGFDPIFSEYEFASSLGLIQGRNPYLYLSGLEERKFNRKEFHNLWSKDEYFRTNFQRILEPYYESLLSEARTFKSPEELIEDNPDLNEELAEQDRSDTGLVFPED